MFWKRKYDELKKDYDCQVKENSVKQDTIHDLKNKLKDLQAELGETKLKLEEAEKIREVKNDRSKHTKRK